MDKSGDANDRGIAPDRQSMGPVPSLFGKYELVGLESQAIVRSLPRWILLLLLLGAELIVLTAPFDTYSGLPPENFSSWFWLTLLHEARPVLITGVVATLFFSWTIAREEFLQVLRESDLRLINWLPWLIGHLLLVTGLCKMTALGRAGAVTAADHEMWLSLWIAVACTALVTWAGAALPLRFWARWLTRGKLALLAGVVLGLTADLFERSTQTLLAPLQHLSVGVVLILLRLLGEPAVTDPQHLVIETPTFAVRIASACSGLEGIGLISAFLTAYLWFFRRELRFPHAIFLIPLGVIASWLFNAVRITILILLASWNSAVGIKGFHSVAGWFFFNLVACATVWFSWRFGFFTDAGWHTVDHSVPNPAAPYLVPFLAIVAASMLARAIPEESQVLVPLRVLAGLGALWCYRREIVMLQWNISVPAVALGAIGFLLWIALAQGDSPSEIASRAVLTGLPGSEVAGWLLLRLVGAVITVPLAEEFAFRGYLIRKLVDSDFLSVAPGRFTWASFIGSSVLFGALHTNWIAGTLAGMIFAVALYRRGILSDAVLAHATTNGLLSAYVLATSRWSLWN